MPTATKPRKQYRPGRAGCALLPGQHTDMVLPVHLALTAIELGHGTEHNRNDIASGINIAGQIAVNVHGGDELVPLLDEAKRAVVSMDRRFRRIGRWGMNAAEIQAIRKAVLIYDQILRRTNTATIEAAIMSVWKINMQHEGKLGTALEPV